MATLEQALSSGGNGAVVAGKVKTLLSSSHQTPLPPVTRKMFNTLSSAISSEMRSRHFSGLSDLLSCLSLILNPSSSPSSPPGDTLQSLLSYGLGRKLVEWLAGLHSMPCTGSMGWRQTCIVMATVAEQSLEACGEDKGRLLLLTTPLLEWVTLRQLPVEARLSSARGVANLLEVMEGGQRDKLVQKHSTLFDELMEGVVSAGDYDLQATMVECCISALRESGGRSSHAHRWFSDHTLISAFMNIHETTFETDCRGFLTTLNRTAGLDRSVHSFLCKKVLLGATELHPPREVGRDGFWLDVNSASLSLSLNVEDPSDGGSGNSGGPPQDSGGLWEMVTVTDQSMESWTMTTERGDVILTVTLTVPSHSLLPSLPPSPHHTLTISFSPSHIPTLPLESLFPSKKATTNVVNLATPTTRHQVRPLSLTHSVKSSVAITPLHIKPSSTRLTCEPGKRPQSSASSISHVSPIEISPTVPPQGDQVCSQGSALLPVPFPTPQTSTPKLPPTSRLHSNTPSSSGAVRAQLQFSSDGASKRSIAISSIHISSHYITTPGIRTTNDGPLGVRTSGTTGGTGGRRPMTTTPCPLTTKPDHGGKQLFPNEQTKQPPSVTKPAKPPSKPPTDKRFEPPKAVAVPPKNQTKRRQPPADANGKNQTKQVLKDQTNTKRQQIPDKTEKPSSGSTGGKKTKPVPTEDQTGTTEQPKRLPKVTSGSTGGKRVPTEDQTGTTEQPKRLPKVTSDNATMDHQQQTCVKTAVDTRGDDDLTDRAELEEKGCGQPHPHQEKPRLPKSASTAASTSGKSASSSAKEGNPLEESTAGTCSRRGRGGKRGGKRGGRGKEGRRGKAVEEEEEGSGYVRPRVGRPPGQRMFVLSHAPLTRADGGHRGRGAGKTKAGRVGGGRGGKVDTAKALVTAFDFGDSPAVGGGVVSPPIPTPHSIPSSLPSPDYIPSSGPHSRPLKSQRSKSILFHSLPDSDYDTDPDDSTWNEDMSSGRSKPTNGRTREPVTATERGAERGDDMERGKEGGEKEKAAAERSSMADKKESVGKKGKREGEKKGKMLATKRAGGRNPRTNPCDSQDSSGETREGVTLAAVKTTGVAVARRKGEGGKRGRGRPRKNNTTSSATAVTDRADTTHDKDFLPPTNGGLGRPTSAAAFVSATDRVENGPENSEDLLPLTKKSNRGGRQTKDAMSTPQSSATESAKTATVDDGWSATVASGGVPGNTTSLAKSGRQKKDNLTSASASTDTNRAKMGEREKSEVSKSAVNKKKQMEKEKVERRRCDVEDDVIESSQEPLSSEEGLQSPTVSTWTSSPVTSGTRSDNVADEVGEVGNRGTRGERSPVRKKPRSSNGRVSFLASPASSASSTHNQQVVKSKTTPPAPPSPVYSVTSSSIGADSDITCRFETICQNLVAQAWNQSPPLPLQSSTADCQSRGKPRAAGGGKKTSRGNGQKEKKERERKEREEEKEEMERKEREEEKEEKERKRRSASETTGQRRRTLTSERKEGLESRQMTPLTPDLANISIRSGSGELPPITLLTRKRRPAVEWENAEQELPVAVAKKPRVTKATKRNPPATGGGVKGLEGVWQEMERERQALIRSHDEGVVKCLTSVEKTLSGAWDCSEQGLLSLGQTLSLMATGISTAERRMEDLRGLMARFQTSLSDMEQRQSQGRGVAQQGLKRDIQLMQQRSIRKVNETQVTKVRQALQAMLMKL